MLQSKPKRILFTGYASVHFVCFQPIYKQLKQIPGIEIYFSGGLRIKSEEKKGLTLYDADGLYRRFRIIPKENIIPVSSISRRTFDMVFCSNVSGFFPKSDKTRVHVFHGISFRNVAIRTNILIFDYLFVVGPYMMRAFHTELSVRQGDPRLLPIGFPKVDRLIDGTLSRKAILNRLGFSGHRPVILYAPTGQRHNSLEKMGEEVIKRLCAENRYDLLIKLHDHPKDESYNWPLRLHKFMDKHTKLLRTPDVIPYLFIADLLITDASSISNEYSLLDRPMVFIDVPELLHVAKKKKQNVDLITWGRRGGITANWPDEVINAVDWSLKHPEHNKSIRQGMAKDLFYNPGKATDAAVKWTLEWLKKN